jgi:hypothetical protein
MKDKELVYVYKKDNEDIELHILKQDAIELCEHDPTYYILD